MLHKNGIVEVDGVENIFGLNHMVILDQKEGREQMLII
jgi:hypothetical protein